MERVVFVPGDIQGHVGPAELERPIALCKFPLGPDVGHLRRQADHFPRPIGDPSGQIKPVSLLSYGTDISWLIRFHVVNTVFNLFLLNLITYLCNINNYIIRYVTTVKRSGNVRACGPGSGKDCPRIRPLWCSRYLRRCRSGLA